MVRIEGVEALVGLQLRLTLTDGRVIDRDVSQLMIGPVFEKLRTDREMFERAEARDGAVIWPNGADLCPDMLIWGGLPPETTSQTDHAAQRHS